MTKTAIKLCALTALAFASQQAAAFNFTTYTSRASWEAAVGSFNEETFADAILEPGLHFGTTGGTHAGLGVYGGEFHDRLLAGPPSTFWFFGSPIMGVGANWDLTPPAGFSGLRLLADGILVELEIPKAYSGGFFGFTTDAPFLEFKILTGTQGGFVEAYDMDNLVWASNLPSIPDGGSSMLLLGSVVTLGAAARRRFGC